MKHSEWVTIAKTNGANILNKVLLRALLRKLPFLVAGPGNYLAVKFVSWLVGEVIDEAEMRVFFVAMDLDTSLEAKELKAIMIRNSTIQKIGTEDDKKAVEVELENSLFKFINLYH